MAVDFSISRQQLSVLLFLIIATAFESQALVEPVKYYNKLNVLKKINGLASVTASCLLLQSLLIKKAEAASASAIEFPDAPAFYQRYQYLEPKDILKYIDDCKISDGDAAAVTDALETFSQYYPMYKLSKEKVNILTGEIKNSKPRNVLEIGTFFGYSALNMGALLQPGAKLTCIEANINNANVARVILDKGLGPNTKARESVNIIDGISSKVLNSKENLLGDVPFDFVFLDHDKDCYLTDLKTLESKGMLAANCLIVADNVVFPGAPGYLEYVSGVDVKTDGVAAPKNGKKSDKKIDLPVPPKGR